MNIKISWCENGRRGYLEYNTEKLIKEMPLANFKRWAKLFSKYGTSEQHNVVLQLIKVFYQEEYEWLNLKLSLKDDRGIKVAQKTMKFYNRKYEILSGLIS